MSVDLPENPFENSFDPTWDIEGRDGYTYRETHPGHWHVVDGPGMCGWYCTLAGRDQGCLSFEDVAPKLLTVPGPGWWFG